MSTLLVVMAYLLVGWIDAVICFRITTGEWRFGWVALAWPIRWWIAALTRLIERIR